MLLSRCGDHAEGRYQCPEPVDAAELTRFFGRYGPYFEGDGRHHVWILSVPTNGLLVYDHHNVIYAYGPLAQFEAELRRRRFSSRPVRFPVPHTHHYCEEFDDTEQQLMQHWRWKHFPLRDQDGH